MTKERAKEILSIVFYDHYNDFAVLSKGFINPSVGVDVGRLLGKMEHELQEELEKEVSNELD